MSDAISRCELFNKLATIPAPPEANDFKAEVYKVIQSMETVESDWISVEDRLPDPDKYVLLSFDNFTLADIGRYEGDDDGGAFYPGDSEKSYVSHGLFVNAWMPLPAPYKEENGKR